MRPTSVARVADAALEYRYEERGSQVVLILHGGHLRACLAVAEDELTAAGYSLLVPSRPGYGQTSLEAGSNPDDFADTLSQLCRQLGITSLAAVIGISAGGRPAAALAARHTHLVEKVVMISAVSGLRWPDRTSTRLAARVVFGPSTERAVWSGIRALLRACPEAGLRFLFHDLAKGRAGPAVAALSPQHRAAAIEMFTGMRSSEGFRHDLNTRAPTPPVAQDMLVVATRADASVSFAHAQAWASQARATLLETSADSHLVWLSPDWPRVAEEIQRFLAGPAPAQ